MKGKKTIFCKPGAGTMEEPKQKDGQPAVKWFLTKEKIFAKINKNILELF